MKTFYILGTDIFDKLPAPKDFDLFKIEAINLDDAVKLASKQSDKRYFCSVHLTVLNKKEVSKETEILEIIIAKAVNISLLMACYSCEEYNNTMSIGRLLTQEEFDLLKGLTY